MASRRSCRVNSNLAVRGTAYLIIKLVHTTEALVARDFIVGSVVNRKRELFRSTTRRSPLRLGQVTDVNFFRDPIGKIVIKSFLGDRGYLDSYRAPRVHAVSLREQ